MTIVCALRDATRGEVWIGCDTRVVSEHFIWPQADRKIVKIGRWTLGFAGSAVALRTAAEAAALIEGATDVAAIQKILFQAYKERGFKQHDHDGPPCYGQETIVCDAQKVWVLTDNGCVAKVEFAAIGSGSDYAYGAWHALRGRVCADEIVGVALKAACAFDTGCGGELVLEKVE